LEYGIVVFYRYLGTDEQANNKTPYSKLGSRTIIFAEGEGSTFKINALKRGYFKYIDKPEKKLFGSIKDGAELGNRIGKIHGLYSGYDEGYRMYELGIRETDSIEPYRYKIQLLRGAGLYKPCETPCTYDPVKEAENKAYEQGIDIYKEGNKYNLTPKQLVVLNNLCQAGYAEACENRCVKSYPETCNGKND